MNDEPAINKDQMYGKFQAGEDWRAELARKGAYKALDIADQDDVNIDAKKNITTNNTYTSATLPAIAVGVAMLAAGLSVPALLPLLHRTPQAQQTATAPGGADPGTSPRPSVPPGSTSPVGPPPPVPPPAAAQAWDAIYEEQLPDGTWKQTRREHLK